MILLALLSVLGQESAIPYAESIGDRARLLSVTVAHDALVEDESLLDQHRGIAEFLKNRPLLDLSEQAYQDHLRSPIFGPLAAAFEEALMQDAAARARYDRYYEALARDQNLSARVDALKRIEIREGRSDASFAAAMIYLKTHPADAATFLDRPLRLIPTPEALYDLRGRFRRDRSLREELKAAFDDLDREAAAHEYVFPWWRSAYEDETEVGRASRALDQHLGRNPQRYWVVHRRNEAWAVEPHARRWLWHFYGTLRRNDSLRDTYLVFLASLRDVPVLREALEDRWRKEFGAPAKWPPADDPPELARWKAMDRERVERPKRPVRLKREEQLPARPVRPDRSGLSVPKRPDRPVPVEPLEPQAE